MKHLRFKSPEHYEKYLLGKSKPIPEVIKIGDKQKINTKWKNAPYELTVWEFGKGFKILHQ